MVKTGLIDNLDKMSVFQKVMQDSMLSTPEAERNKAANLAILKQLKMIGKEGGLETIMAAETKLLENEKVLHSNDAVMGGSLDMALAEIKVANALLPAVKDKALYQSVDKSFSLPKNRIGGVPRDEARQFYRSHNARLLNLNKARLTPEEKAIIEARRSNIRIAEKLYTYQQREILGLQAENKKAKEQGMSL